jgi:hypothetical protein
MSERPEASCQARQGGQLHGGARRGPEHGGGEEVEAGAEHGDLEGLPSARWPAEESPPEGRVVCSTKVPSRVASGVRLYEMDS